MSFSAPQWEPVHVKASFCDAEVCLFNCQPWSIRASRRATADRFQRMGITGRANRKCPAITATEMIRPPPDLAVCKPPAF